MEPLLAPITSFNQATLYQRLGRYERAMQIYREVEQSSKDFTASDRAHLFANLGALYRRLGDPVQALDIYRAAQKLYSEQHDAAGELTVTKNIGIVYALDMEDLTQAKLFFSSAILLAQRRTTGGKKCKLIFISARHYFGRKTLRMPKRNSILRNHWLPSSVSTEEQWKSLYGVGRIEEQIGNLSAAEQTTVKRWRLDREDPQSTPISGSAVGLLCR